MRKRINDIRIINKTEKINSGVTSSFSNSVNSIEKISDDTSVSKNRRNFLKLVLAGGGVLVAGSIFNKLDKFNGFNLTNNHNKFINNLYENKSKEYISQDEDDLIGFFENFRIVKNKKEYILYNKQGENILIIDRDA